MRRATLLCRAVGRAVQARLHVSASRVPHLSLGSPVVRHSAAPLAFGVSIGAFAYSSCDADPAVALCNAAGKGKVGKMREAAKQLDDVNVLTEDGEVRTIHAALSTLTQPVGADCDAQGVRTRPRGGHARPDGAGLHERERCRQPWLGDY